MSEIVPHQQFVDSLRQHLTQRQTETVQRMQVPESLSGIIAITSQFFQHGRVYSEAIREDGTAALFTPVQQSMDVFVAARETAVARLSPNSLEKLSQEQADVLAIKHLRRNVLDSAEASFDARVDALLGLAGAAGWNKPDTDAGHTSKVFTQARAAINHTRKQAEIRVDDARFALPADTFKHFSPMKNDPVVRLILGDDAYETVSEQSNIVLAANKILEVLDNPSTTAEQFRDEVFMVEMYERHQKAVAAQPDVQPVTVPDDRPEIPLQETRWTILPPDLTGPLEIRPDESTPGKYGSRGESRPVVIDMGRMRKLGELAASWGPEAYIAVANLDGTGVYDYRVAVLPQTLPSGAVIEHAVAENPASQNATFAFRAEQGLEDDGFTTWLTWKDVFSDNRRNAATLGARRMLHVPTHQQNIVEYLTRDPADLDRPGYKR